MDVAIAPAHRAERGAQVSAHGVQKRFAKRQPTGGVTDERRKDIARPQRHPTDTLKASWPRPRKTPPWIFPAR
jgi:hypothetical protein